MNASQNYCLRCQTAPLLGCSLTPGCAACGSRAVRIRRSAAAAHAACGSRAVRISRSATAAHAACPARLRKDERCGDAEYGEGQEQHFCRGTIHPLVPLYVEGDWNGTQMHCG